MVTLPAPSCRELFPARFSVMMMCLPSRYLLCHVNINQRFASTKHTTSLDQRFAASDGLHHRYVRNLVSN